MSFVLLVGCQSPEPANSKNMTVEEKAFADKLDLIHQGSSKADVLAVLGQPNAYTGADHFKYIVTPRTAPPSRPVPTYISPTLMQEAPSGYRHDTTPPPPTTQRIYSSGSDRITGDSFLDIWFADDRVTRARFTRPWSRGTGFDYDPLQKSNVVTPLL